MRNVLFCGSMLLAGAPHAQANTPVKIPLSPQGGAVLMVTQSGTLSTNMTCGYAPNGAGGFNVTFASVTATKTNASWPEPKLDFRGDDQRFSMMSIMPAGNTGMLLVTGYANTGGEVPPSYGFDGTQCGPLISELAKAKGSTLKNFDYRNMTFFDQATAQTISQSSEDLARALKTAYGTAGIPSGQRPMP